MHKKIKNFPIIGLGSSQSYFNFTVQKISAQPTAADDSNTNQAAVPPAEICNQAAAYILKKSSFKTGPLGMGENYVTLGGLDFNVESSNSDPSSPDNYRYQVKLHDTGPLLTRLIADSAGYVYFVVPGKKVDLTTTVMGVLSGKYQTTSNDQSQVEVKTATNEIILQSDVCHLSAILKVDSVQVTSDGLLVATHFDTQKLCILLAICDFICYQWRRGE